jgi:hypothetical protein
MTAAVIVDFKDTTFSIPTAYATGKVITAITNASPPVVTSAGHLFTDYDVVKLSGIVGMTELNDKLCVVDVISADTFSLIGVDATNYDAYASGGTASKATMTQTCQCTSYSGPTGQTPTSTVVTSCGPVKTFGDPELGAANVGLLYAPGSFRQTLRNANKNGDLVAIKIVLPRNKGICFDIGRVTSLDRGASANGSWTGDFVLERTEYTIEIDPS